ncbi:MAG: hypothetical protein KatS3mg109_0483 [Pirellulaceae bacterium]|nr:MAG: hypothetical protein KatS3mg109_0483 [Pirellulaceae bacterium]
MSGLFLIVALVPLAGYLALLGITQCRRRPFVTTGSRDMAALGLALIGCVLAGPMQLLMPLAAAYQFGPYVWLLLALLYLLSLAMLALAARPRLVIYNATFDQVRPLLADVVFRLDAEARWAGECVNLPNLGVQFHITASPLMHTVQLIAVGRRQSIDGWKKLERSLAPRLKQVKSRRHPLAWLLLASAGVLLAISVAQVVHDPRALHAELLDTLRLSPPLPARQG